MNKFLILMILPAFFWACGEGASQPQETQLPPASAQLKKAQALEQQVAALMREDEVAGLDANEKVIAAFREVVRLDSNYVVAASWPLGKANFMAKNYMESLRWLETAAAADPNSYEVYKMLGLAYVNTGNIQSGLQNLAESIGIQDTEENREDIVNNLFEIGKTSFEYGVEYENDKQFNTGKDYKNYGIAVLQNAYDLHGSSQKIAKQIIAYADLTGDKEVAETYRKLIK